MQKTAVSWIIYEKTHSDFMLGLSLFASMFPSFVFSFLGGVISDRYDRFKVLLVTQVASMIQALLLTALVFFNHYVIWQIIALSAVLGIINAFDVPARQSLVYEMVDDKADLPNALALNSSMVNLSRLIGPGIAGLILEHFGDTICFGLNAFSFIAVLSSLWLMKLPAFGLLKPTTNMFEDLKDGLSYIKNTPAIKHVLIMLALISLLVLPFTTLIPVYAKDIFNGTAATFGVIDSVIGLGAFIGAIYLASLKAGRDLKVILAINTLIFGAGLLLFSYTKNYHLALVFATVAGFGMMSQITISNTLIQTIVAPAMRGRVISFYAVAFFGMQPLGGLLIGGASEKVGAPVTMLVQGCIAVLIGITHISFLRRQKLRKLDRAPLSQRPVEMRAS